MWRLRHERLFTSRAKEAGQRNGGRKRIRTWGKSRDSGGRIEDELGCGRSRGSEDLSKGNLKTSQNFDLLGLSQILNS